MAVGVRKAKDTPGALLAWWNASRPGQAMNRFGQSGGSVLAAGIAFYGVFSIFPALAIGFTAFAAFLGGRLELQADLVDYVNKTFGFTVVGMHAGDGGLVTIDQLVLTPRLVGIYGIVSLLILLWTGLGWLSASRTGIRTVFGQPPTPNFVLGKLVDLAILCTLGLLVLASVVTSVLVTTATGVVLDWLEIARGTGAMVLVQLTSNALLLGADAIILLLFFRALAGVAVPLRDLLTGALAGAVGLLALTVVGGLLLQKAANNQFLAVFGTIIGLLLWTNIAARIVLVAASWSATTAIARGHLVPVVSPVAAQLEADHGKGRAQEQEAGPERRPRFELDPSYGVRSGDKVTLAAGAVLGVTVMLTGRLLSGAARAVRDVIS